ncbi:MAG: hypothetical protein ACLFRD_06910 [Nitriliruptoraceae bacterium]
MPSAAHDDATRYLERATAAYQEELRTLLEHHGVPQADAAFAGRRAAALAAAGQAWNEAAGPFYDTQGARAALGGVSKQAVSQRVHHRRLLALRLAPDGSGVERLVYPAWQFRSGVLGHLPGVLAAAGYDPHRAVTGWTIAAWLTSPDPDLDGHPPLELLEAGHVTPVLVSAAEVRGSLGVEERAAAGTASR